MHHDQFTDLNVSRQRKYQLRMKQKGNCIQCGKLASRSGFCIFHYEKYIGYKEFRVSKGEREFLNYLMVPQRQIFVKSICVDGIDKNTIYEFLGDYYHGNPKTFSHNDVNKTVGKKFGELYKETFTKFKILKDDGYKVNYIWESDWNRFVSGKDLTPNIIDFSD